MEGPVERFLSGLDADASIPADARELIHTAWADCKDCDGEEFLTQGLAMVSERFRTGLDAYDVDQYETCASIMGELRNDRSLSVAVNAAAYEIKSLVALDRFPEAASRIDELKARGDNVVAAYSYLAAEIDFLTGYCLLADLQYGATEAALGRFLDDHPDAPQRLVLPARQILAELANRQPGDVGEVADLMGYCGRRLRNHDSGTKVQGRQQRVIELLDRLIEDAQQREQSGGGGGAGGSQSGSPGSPAQESQLPAGGPDAGPLGPDRRANPGEAWGAMPPAQRERILQALRDSFPARYRRLVEQYYEELAKKP
jgi:hypothetical protein